MYEDLEIRELQPGARASGVYRGQKFHEVDDPRHGLVIMGRVFLDTDDGPAAIGGDEGLRDRLKALNPSDGDRIIIERPSHDMYVVIKEVDS